MKKMSIKSPMDGIVVMNSIVRNGEFGQIREGDQVNAGQPFMTIVDPTFDGAQRHRQPGGCREAAAGHEGRRCAWTLIRDVELPGTLVGIGAMSKTSTFRAGYVGEIPIRLKIEKMDPRVIPDLTGSAEIVLGTETQHPGGCRAPRCSEENGGFVRVCAGPEGLDHEAGGARV